MSVRGRYWQARFARWGRPAHPHPQPGYSLLLPVPGDLPVFLELALAVCRLQDPTHRVETLVIPDRSTAAVRRVVADARRDWPDPLRLLPLPAAERLVLPRLGDPGRNHGAQLVTGVRAAQADRIVLHDADLFLRDPRVHADEFELAEKEDVDVLGISPAWDDWYAERGRRLAATWELCGRVAWFRDFPPHRHFGHDAVVDGERHTFDTTFWPQLHTGPGRIDVGVGLAERTVHFNYTISTYRLFQRAARSREPFRDKAFRILLIRLFVELFGRVEHPYGLPTLEQLGDGLHRGGQHLRVLYSRQDGETYRRVREGLGAVVEGPWSSPERAARCRELLAAFDEHFKDFFVVDLS
ncbi:hypothetical protein ACIB24_21130 [Spongisporangium articulatum]|uniref:Glycosyltransferase 2-like domain-containing protein n=1 Tax=Spongisporangium articulatum TaxID=3362603 RepID=A0ABW8AU20_9ACTN